MGELSFILAGLLAGVDPSLLSAVCYVESTHNPNAYVAHDGGSPSIGLCQIKLTTAQHMGFQGKETDLLNPRTNVYYAAKYLAFQKSRHGSWENAVSAYNCGRPCGNKGYVKKVRTRYELTRPLNKQGVKWKL